MQVSTASQLLSSEGLKQLKDVQVIAMCGLPGSGKSYIGKMLAEALGATIIASDTLRAKLFKTTRLDPIGEQAVHAQAEQIFTMIYDTAIDMANQGQKVVIDASNLKRARPDQIKRLKEKGIKTVIVVVSTDENIIRSRAQATGKTNSNGESWEDATFRVRGYFHDRYKRGEWEWPSEVLDDVPIIEVTNN